MGISFLLRNLSNKKMPTILESNIVNNLYKNSWTLCP